MTNTELIKTLYQHFANRDFEKIRNIFSPDIIWQQMEGFPGGGKYTGADAIFENVFKGFKDNWTDWKTEIDEYKETDDTVFVSGRYTGTYNATQKNVSAEFMHVYKIIDQKVTMFTQYTDTRLIAESMLTKN